MHVRAISQNYQIDKRSKICEMFVKKGCLYAFELLSRDFGSSKCTEAFISVNYECASDRMDRLGPGCLLRP